MDDLNLNLNLPFGQRRHNMINHMTNSQIRHTTMLRYYFVDFLINLCVSTLLMLKFIGIHQNMYLNSFSVTFCVFVGLFLLGPFLFSIFAVCMTAKWAESQPGPTNKLKIVLQSLFYIIPAALSDTFLWTFMVSGGAGLWPHDDRNLQDLEGMLVCNCVSSFPKQVATIPLLLVVGIFKGEYVSLD